MSDLKTLTAMAGRARMPAWAAALGGIGFGVLFTVGQQVAGALETGSLPLPGAPVSAVVSYYAANPTATTVLAVFVLLAASALAGFANYVGVVLRSTLARVAGMTSAALLAVSALLSVTLTGVAGQAAPGVVDALRQANFYTGGVAHIVTLGVFLGAACWPRAFPAAVRWFGLVVAAMAILSVASLFWYYASVLLPVSRMLAFVWAVVAAVVLLVQSRRSAVEGR